MTTSFVSILIIVHAFLGGVSLLSGSTSMFTKKGSSMHKKSGLVFSWSLVLASLLAIPVTFQPGHKNLFLFIIAFFSIYLVLSGNRALRFKTKLNKASWVDYLISGVMIVFSIAFIYFGVSPVFLGDGEIKFLFLFFGCLSLFLAIPDFFFYKSGHLKSGLWLRTHISKLMGAYIASWTAFLLTALQTNSILVWILPSVLGTIFIVYWQRKVRKKSLYNRL